MSDPKKHDNGQMSFGLFQREQRSLFGEILDWMLTPLLLLSLSLVRRSFTPVLEMMLKSVTCCSLNPRRCWLALKILPIIF